MNLTEAKASDGKWLIPGFAYQKNEKAIAKERVEVGQRLIAEKIVEITGRSRKYQQLVVRLKANREISPEEAAMAADNPYSCCFGATVEVFPDNEFVVSVYTD